MSSDSIEEMRESVAHLSYVIRNLQEDVTASAEREDALRAQLASERDRRLLCESLLSEWLRFQSAESFESLENRTKGVVQAAVDELLEQRKNTAVQEERSDDSETQRPSLVMRLQNSPLTRWLWRYWQHDETGRAVMLIFWKNPGRRWHVVDWKE